MDFNTILSHFVITGEVQEVKPLGNGLINDTYFVKTVSDNDPDYVLQRINNDIFTDVDLLQRKTLIERCFLLFKLLMEKPIIVMNKENIGVSLCL